MSGWENLPQETPSSPAAESGAAAPQPEEQVIDGDLLRAAEWYFPALWCGMLAVIAFIGVYSAVGKLPNHPW